MEKFARPVLLYDGECGLCNAVMRFMLKHDRRGVLWFAPLQGRTGQRLLRQLGLDTEDFDSIVFIDDLTAAEAGDAGVKEGVAAGFALRSAAVLCALGELGGAYRTAARVLRVIPASWRDAVYGIVARLRYRLFGPYRPSPLPNPEWERRVLE